jgi:hypothetical protein
MADPKETKSNPEEKSQDNGFNCCDGNIEEMFGKMKEFCGSKEKSFDCCEMMQKMFSKNADKLQK